MSVKKVVSIIVVTLAVIAGGIYYYFSSAMTDLDHYIRPMYAELVEQHWTQQAMNKFLCKSAKAWFQDPANAAQIKKMQDEANALGKIISYGGVNINDGFSISTSTDKNTTGEATVPITFENGKKNLETNLSKEDGKWCLTGFNIVEPAKDTTDATKQEPAATKQPSQPVEQEQQNQPQPATPAQDQQNDVEQPSAPRQDQQNETQQPPASTQEQQDENQQPPASTQDQSK